MFRKLLVCWAPFILTAVHLHISEVQGDLRQDTYIQCDEGWFFFGGKCYKLFGAMGIRLNWSDASKRCRSLDGHLATIPSKEVQEFLFSFLLLEADTFSWIGLSDIENETHYVWDDGTVYNYSNWNTLQPSKAKGNDCVNMLATVSRGEPGEWNARKCADSVPYICQVDAGIQKKISPNPTLCPSANGVGWKFGDSCYNFIKDDKTWEDAEQNCQGQYKGHLVKVLNFNVNYFLTYIMENFSTDIWIGIKIKDQLQQQFTSGWYAQNTYWRHRHQDSIDGTCVIRTKEKLFKVVPCTEKYPFICEVSTVSPPILKKPPEGSKCPEEKEDWIDLGGEFCYFLNNLKGCNWYQAHFECTTMGGSLVSIHSKEEVDGLGAFMKFRQYPSRNSNWRVFIGLYGSQNRDNAPVWVDGSKMDYAHWNVKQPDMKYGKCVYMHVKNNLWYGIDCGENIGYLCSIRKIPPNVKKAEVTSDSINGISFRTFIGVTVSLILLVILLPIVVYFLR